MVETTLKILIIKVSEMHYFSGLFW